MDFTQLVFMFNRDCTQIWQITRIAHWLHGFHGLHTDCTYCTDFTQMLDMFHTDCTRIEHKLHTDCRPIKDLPKIYSKIKWKWNKLLCLEIGAPRISSTVNFRPLSHHLQQCTGWNTCGLLIFRFLWNRHNIRTNCRILNLFVLGNILGSNLQGLWMSPNGPIDNNIVSVQRMCSKVCIVMTVATASVITTAQVCPTCCICHVCTVKN